jgi:hypothetical protein
MEFRQIFTDGRPLPADQQPSWGGYSTGTWDGDTLVVRTSGLRDGLWADFAGSPLTSRATITERFRRPAYGRLEVEVTVDDPGAYMRPWTIRLNQHIALDTDLLEYACLGNEKDVPSLGDYAMNRVFGWRYACCSVLRFCRRRHLGYVVVGHQRQIHFQALGNIHRHQRGL